MLPTRGTTLGGEDGGGSVTVEVSAVRACGGGELLVLNKKQLRRRLTHREQRIFSPALKPNVVFSHARHFQRP